MNVHVTCVVLAAVQLSIQAFWPNGCGPGGELNQQLKASMNVGCGDHEYCELAMSGCQWGIL